MGNVILDLIKGVTDRQLGSDLGDRKTGRLRCQCTRSRNTWVHLNHDDATIIWIYCELDITSASCDANFANNIYRKIAQLLKFNISERERRSYGN